MEESEKKGVVPVEEDDIIDVHDLLARATSKPPDLKQEKEESWLDSLADDLPTDVKDVREKVVDSNGMNSGAATSKSHFFCALCRLHVPNTVSKLIIPPEPQKTTVRLKLLKKYSVLTVQEALRGYGTIVICGRHVEEEKTPTQKRQSFCTICQSLVPTTVPLIVILPPHHSKYKERIEQAILEKCGAQAIEVAKRIFEENRPLVICRHHLEEKKQERLPSPFFCTFCREQKPETVPKLVIPADLLYKELIKQQLLKKCCKWKAASALRGNSIKSICQEHVEVDGSDQEGNVKSKCSLCGNDQILLKYTTVIPSDSEQQELFRSIIIEAPAAADRNRVKQLFASLQKRKSDSEPLRICDDHVNEGDIPVVPTVPVVRKPRKPRPRQKHKKPQTAEQLEAERIKRKAYYDRRKANETEEQAAERKRKMYEKWERIKSDPVKIAELRRRNNEKRKLTRTPETPEQKEVRRLKDKERQLRRKREREEREKNGGSGVGVKEDEKEEDGEKEKEDVDENAETTQMQRPKEAKKTEIAKECVEGRQAVARECGNRKRQRLGKEEESGDGGMQG